MQEYLLTNVAAPAGGAAAHRPLPGTRRRPRRADVRWSAVAPEYLEAALDEMRKEFGTIEGYFTEGLKVDDAAQAGPPRRVRRGLVT
jgi:hypothetical protein